LAFPVGVSPTRFRVGCSFRPHHTHIHPSRPLDDPCSPKRTRRTLRGPCHHFLAEARNRFPGSSHGVFSKTAPPSTSLRGCCIHRSGVRGANLERRPSVPFFPASTVCSPLSFAGLLHPAADHGVRSVSSLSPTAETAVSRQTLLSNAYPSELFPPRQAESRHPDIAAWCTKTRSPHTVVCAEPEGTALDPISGA
jgi:hypothetical protein